MPLRTDGERRPLSDHADVILNDTDEGVNLVVDNRDKSNYVLTFNFTQSENLNLKILGKTKLLDEMKCSVEAPANAVTEVADFLVPEDFESGSIAVCYRVQCLIRNARTGKLETVPSARDQAEGPEERHRINDSMDLITVKGARGYVSYIENRGAPSHVQLDFSPSTNLEIRPLTRKLKQSSAMSTAVDVPKGRIEFADLLPRERGPMTIKFSSKVGPAKSNDFPATVDKINEAVGSGAGSGSPKAPSSPKQGSPTVATGSGAGGDDGWEEHEGDEKWDHFGFDDVDAATNAAAASNNDAWTLQSSSPAGSPRTPAGPGDNGPRADGKPWKNMTDQGVKLDNDFIGKAFKNLNRECGYPAAEDKTGNSRNWTVYRWILKNWEEERTARIKIEAEWKVRYGALIKQWHCSVCNICRRLLLEQGTKTDIVHYKEYKLHKECYEKAPKCDMCSEILVGEYVVARGAGGKAGTKLHTACIDAYKQKTRPKCSVCGKQIMDAKWGTSGSAAYHFGCKK